LRPVAVPIDGDGFRPDLLADAFAMTGARLLCCQPTFDNPTGIVLAPVRRGGIGDVARAAGAFVVEDDFARHLGHGGPVSRPRSRTIATGRWSTGCGQRRRPLLPGRAVGSAGEPAAVHREHHA
jgi:DNA-binding transcriptional MocR family regulator